MSGEDKVLGLNGGITTVKSLEDNLHSYTNNASAVAVGDVVYQDGSVNDKVVTARSSTASSSPPIGVVSEIVDTTNCIVCHSGGIVTGLSGLTRGAKYWLTDAGSSGNTLQSSEPTSNKYLVGVALSASSLLITLNPFSLDGEGDVSGPGSSTDNAIAKWSGTDGTLLQDSEITINVNGDLLPKTDDAQDLGSSSLRWRDLYLGSVIDYTSALEFHRGGFTHVTLDDTTFGGVSVGQGPVSTAFGGYGLLYNGFSYSEDFSQSPWVLGPAANDTVTLGTQPSPDGTFLGTGVARRVTLANSVDNGTRIALRYNSGTYTGNSTYVVSFWARKFSGDFTALNVDIGDTGGQSVTINSNWARYSLLISTGGSPSGWVDFNVTGHTAGVDDIFDLWGVQISISGSTRGGPYVATNGTAYTDGLRGAVLTNGMVFTTSGNPKIESLNGTLQIEVPTNEDVVIFENGTEWARFDSSAKSLSWGTSAGLITGSSTMEVYGTTGLTLGTGLNNDILFQDGNNTWLTFDSSANEMAFSSTAFITTPGALFLDAGTNQDIVFRGSGAEWVRLDESLKSLTFGGSTGQIDAQGGNLTLKSSNNILIDCPNDMYLQDSGTTWIQFNSSLKKIDFGSYAATIEATDAITLNSVTGAEDVLIQANGTSWAQFDSSIECLLIGSSATPGTVNEMLQLRQNSAADCTIRLISNDGSSAYVFTDDSDNDALSLQSSSHLKFLSNGINEAMRIDTGGSVLIGATLTRTPEGRLDVRRTDGDPCIYMGTTSISTSKTLGLAEFESDASIEQGSYWWQFRRSSNTIMGGIRGNDDSTTVVYATFAGHHDGYNPGSTYTNGNVNDGAVEWQRGMILCSNGNRCTDGTDTTEEPEVILASTASDKTVVGIYQSAVADGSEQAGMNSAFPVADYAAVGHAVILVTDEDGNVNNGDLVTTSGTCAGYGKLQADDIIHSYTVAKVTEQVDWANITDTVNGHKYALVACFVYCG